MKYFLKNNIWKLVVIVLLLYTVIGGFLMTVPRLAILNETIRALHFHVPMWFGMVILLMLSWIYAIRSLSGHNQNFDDYAVELAKSGTVFGSLGLITGMVWAKYTWGEYWSGDPKQNAAAVGMLIYLAYFILRGSLTDSDQRTRISGIYNIFSFPVLIALLFILPRLKDSLHPGNGGNPGFNSYDLDSNLRMVFYPAVIGWTFLGLWVTTVGIRKRKIERLINEKNLY